MNQGHDRIEREIHIDSDAQAVWELVSTPGWYINDGQIREHSIDTDGDASVVHDPEHGDFTFHTVRLDEPRHTAFRSYQNEPDGSAGDTFTLVEFWITDQADGGVTLRVAESGFESLGGTVEQREASFDDNTQGWPIELEAARTYLQT